MLETLNEQFIGRDDVGELVVQKLHQYTNRSNTLLGLKIL
jgi:hypothetical protein